MDKSELDLKSSYDVLAEEYAERYFNELEEKPFDRKLLEEFAKSMKDNGVVCDLGCGPGQIARFLHERGLQVTGIDLSPAMVTVAQQRNPDIPFQQGDLLNLNVENEAWAGIVAFYSLIHISPDRVQGALTEMKRVLKPRGRLLLSFHIGEASLHLDELWGHKVAMDFYFFTIKEMLKYLRLTGFVHEDSLQRAPYKDVEYESQRAYILARKRV
ncbi:MAG: class I SAM-dependent methyltransferase [bacterium]